MGTLSVVDTTGDSELHAKYGLSFDRGTRTARLTQLAVLKPYRGLKIPLKLIFEAYRRFVWTRGFDVTWLIFDAATAQSSLYCSILDYEMSSGVFTAEYGKIRVLLRSEGAGVRPFRRETDRGAGGVLKRKWSLQFQFLDPTLSDSSRRCPSRSISWKVLPVTRFFSR